MNNFIFENATKTFFGKGCVKEYLACLCGRYGDTVMLCYGGGSIRRNGIYDEVMACLRKAGKTVVEFSGIMANPTYAKVLEGAKLARENKVDLILGVGGGSVMDCCKAISLAAVYDGDVWADFWARPGVVDFAPLPLGVVVTVAGTGSEMNGGAVITNEALKIKTGRDYSQCNPRFALMDPTYTYSVPVQQLASGGSDILSHIMAITAINRLCCTFACKSYSIGPRKKVGMLLTCTGSEPEEMQRHVRSILTLPSASRAITEYKTEVFTGCVSADTCRESADYLERARRIAQWAAE